MRFEGKTVIVTGAGSGIGKATVLRIAEEGGRVIAADSAKDSLVDLVNEHPGLAIVPVAGDLTCAADVAEILEAAEGDIDGLANVAGVMDSLQPAHEVDDEQWDEVFAVNVTVPMKLMRAVIPGMLENGRGAIVNVASEAGLRGAAGGAAYTAAKHAVVGLTKNSAVMYAKQGIRVNAVAPGVVANNLVAEFASMHSAAVLGPLMRANVPAVASCDALAAAVTWLLSDDSANINGVVLASDGGWSAV